ncbi:hypothetical protein HanRHA438_Chr11g0502101 [Helianthus annuus]|nr:hypothetical protein HanRHA438_Chr11g0502101 [Helianthus annuus]
MAVYSSRNEKSSLVTLLWLWMVIFVIFETFSWNNSNKVTGCGIILLGALSRHFSITSPPHHTRGFKAHSFNLHTMIRAFIIII